MLQLRSLSLDLYLRTIIYFLLIFVAKNNFPYINVGSLTLPKNVATHVPPPGFGYGYLDCDKTAQESFRRTHPDQFMKTDEVLEKYGYPYEEHRVTTKDGYILTVFRITDSPNLKEKKKGKNKPPAYLNHGILTSSDCWFFQPGSRNLPFMLADEGFDVWLGNARGSSYSLEHETLHYDKDLDYWDFSFHELAIYDVPAVTDKILSETGYTQLWYVGFSMGTTQAFIGLSELPELNDKFIAAFLLSPVAYVGHCSNALRSFTPFLDREEKVKTVSKLTRGRSPSMPEIRKIFQISVDEVCAMSAANCGLCDNLWFFLFGYNPGQMNKTELPNIYAKIPNSASLKQISHYIQLFSSCKFQKYNYYPVKNLLVYGNIFPPEYNLKNIKVPVYMYYGEKDNFALPMDVNVTASRLKKGILKRLYKVKNDFFTHADFIIAKDADKLLYNLVLKDMKKYKLKGSKLPGNVTEMGNTSKPVTVDEIK